MVCLTDSKTRMHQKQASHPVAMPWGYRPKEDSGTCPGYHHIQAWIELMLYNLSDSSIFSFENLKRKLVLPLKLGTVSQKNSLSDKHLSSPARGDPHGDICN